MKKPFALLATCIAVSVPMDRAMALESFSWNDHGSPFTFRFGNEFDTHQQSKQTSGGGIAGFLYIRFTGTVTKDRYRVASHADCNATSDCTVGWTFSGSPITATFLYQEMDDHPVFFVERASIPQPGAYSHFHWFGAMPAPDQTVSGYLLELAAVDTFCFIHHDATSAVSDKTCADNGGIKLRPGIDVASHLNVVTSFPP